jgi:SAM-dependent methyltransferase
MDTAVNKKSEVYYSGKYWNDYPQVLQYMCENFTGDKNKWWIQDFKDRFAAQPFERGLFLNCGNGWAERDFIDKNIVRHAVGFDYAHDLLMAAEREKGGRSIDYFQTDVNKIDFAREQFDLIINVAALHHVQYINRLCQILCETIQPGGLFVHFDYIGPRRNQYSLLHWLILESVNNGLPAAVRNNSFRRPHLPTMLVNDPTEAIHSDIIFETVERYFEIFERHDTGGGIAYQIMTHNQNMQVCPAEEVEPVIAHLLELDRKFSRSKFVPPLFSYFIAKPRKTALRDEADLRHFQERENQRERTAARRGGVYSWGEFLTLKILSNSGHTRWRVLRWAARIIRGAFRRANR